MNDGCLFLTDTHLNIVGEILGYFYLLIYATLTLCRRKAMESLHSVLLLMKSESTKTLSEHTKALLILMMMAFHKAPKYYGLKKKKRKSLSQIANFSFC